MGYNLNLFNKYSGSPKSNDNLFSFCFFQGINYILTSINNKIIILSSVNYINSKNSEHFKEIQCIDTNLFQTPINCVSWKDSLYPSDQFGIFAAASYNLLVVFAPSRSFFSESIANFKWSPRVFFFPQGNVYSISWHPKNIQIVTAGDRITYWTTKKSNINEMNKNELFEELYDLCEKDYVVTHTSFSPDGRLFATIKQYTPNIRVKFIKHMLRFIISQRKLSIF